MSHIVLKMPESTKNSKQVQSAGESDSKSFKSLNSRRKPKPQRSISIVAEHLIEQQNEILSKQQKQLHNNLFPPVQNNAMNYNHKEKARKLMTYWQQKAQLEECQKSLDKEQRFHRKGRRGDNAQGIFNFPPNNIHNPAFQIGLLFGCGAAFLVILMSLKAKERYEAWMNSSPEQPETPHRFDEAHIF